MFQCEFQDKKLEEKYKEKEKQLLGIANASVNDKKYIWNQTAHKYAVTMERVKRVLQTEGMKEYDTQRIINRINSLLEQCSSAEFQIALVGAIKAGKSTLINALLGYEYASTKVTPETASLTKFRKADKNYIKISFYTENEWERVWNSAEKSKARVFLEEYNSLNAEAEKKNWVGKEICTEECENNEMLVKLIEKWTSSKSPAHYFVKEVEVGLQDFGLPEGVILVDTPGLDDVVEYRSNITKEYIEKANAVLVCVKSDALTGQEMATIYGVFSNKRNHPEQIYIIATQIDTLNHPQEDWRQQREEWLKHLKGKGAYGNLKLAEKNLVEVSAYLNILLKNYADFEKDDDRRWDLRGILSKFKVEESNLETDQNTYIWLLDFTNIERLKDRLKKEVVDKRTEIMMNDIKNHYDICKEEILSFIRKKRRNQEELLSTSQSSAQEIERKYQEISAKYQEAENDRKQLENIIKKFEMMAKEQVSELEKTIKSVRSR